MDNKVLAIIAAVIIIAGAGGVAIFALGGDEEQTKADIDASVVIYGNANNDAYIDQDDIDFIQDIIDNKTNWDKAKNPFADANNDGTIDSKDIDKVKMIINNESGKIFYKNYFNEAQEISYPLKDRTIAVTYWQQAEIAAILGEWDNVKVANAYVTQVKNEQYPLDGVKEVGTVGSSAKSVNDQGVEIMIENGVNLILATPTDAVKAGCERVTGAEAIYLWHSGNSVFPTVLTMGIMFDKEDRAMAFVDYCNGVIDKVTDRLDGVDKKSVVVANMFKNQAERDKISVCAGMDVEGTVTVLNYLCDVYTADDCGWSGQCNRTVEWFIQNPFDNIFIVYSSVDQFTYDQATFNNYFEQYAEILNKTQAYKNGGISGNPYIYAGYSGFSMLLYAAWEIYPDLFTLEEAEQSLQYWFDNFTVADVNIHDDAVCWYDGDKYQTIYRDTIPKE